MRLRKARSTMGKKHHGQEEGLINEGTHHLLLLYIQQVYDKKKHCRITAHADIKRATCDVGVFSREIRIVFQISTVQSDYKLRGLRCIPVPGAPTQLSSMWSRNVTQMAVWCVWCCEANERKADSGLSCQWNDSWATTNGHYSLQPNLIGENNVIPNDCMSIHLALII